MSNISYPYSHYSSSVHTRARRDPQRLYSGSGSYLPGAGSGSVDLRKRVINSAGANRAILSAYNSHDAGYSTPSQASYYRKYLETDYSRSNQLKRESLYTSSSSHHDPSSLMFRSLDPRASYIADMESREFGSHVDMIQTLQLRSSLMEPLTTSALPPLDSYLDDTKHNLSTDTLLKPEHASYDIDLNTVLPKETYNVSSYLIGVQIPNTM